ncbi:MAG: DUF1501 domain-containing protein [Lentisphaeraceae bacterium]|nr:DUF1501 domain-containing protein [Lentisphaeraceae bacterium]
MTIDNLKRRHFIKNSGLSLGAMALGMMNANAEEKAHYLTHNPKVKSVIYLHMAGSPSQLDLFDPKPTLKRLNGTLCPKELFEGKRFAFIKQRPTLLGSPFDFKKYGECGMEMSSLLPNLGSVADELCLIRSMNTDQFNHAPAQLLLHTGKPQFGGASMGAWVNYGLGTMNKDLPGYVVLTSGGKFPSSGKSVWGSGFLPSKYQGVHCRSKGDPILYVSNPDGLNKKGRRNTLDTLNTLNRKHASRVGDPEIDSRIAQYELAYRMQSAVPDIVDLKTEPQHILDMYGAKPGFVSAADSAKDPRDVYKANDAAFANNCLLARKMVESGVRFVHLFDWGWDHHGNSKGESLEHSLVPKCGQIDRPISALIKDLKQRGLLDSTLIVCSGEFGRTPMSQRNDREWHGRDHQPDAFSIWMAGAGVKKGHVHGSTTELGNDVATGKVHVNDLQATILHLMGIEPHKFSYSFQGLDQRLIGPSEHPKVIKEILS